MAIIIGMVQTLNKKDSTNKKGYNMMDCLMMVQLTSAVLKGVYCTTVMYIKCVNKYHKNY